MSALIDWLTSQGAFFKSKGDAGGKTVTHTFSSPVAGVCCLGDIRDIASVRDYEPGRGRVSDPRLREVYDEWHRCGRGDREELVERMRQRAFGIFFELYVLPDRDPRRPTSVCETPPASSFVMFADLDVSSEFPVTKVDYDIWSIHVISSISRSSERFVRDSNIEDFAMTVCQKTDPDAPKRLTVPNDMMGMHIVWSRLVSDVAFLGDLRADCISGLVEEKVPVRPGGGVPRREEWEKTWDPAAANAKSTMTLRMVGSAPVGKKSAGNRSRYVPTWEMYPENGVVVAQQLNASKPEDYKDWLPETSIFNIGSLENQSSHRALEREQDAHLMDLVRRNSVRNRKPECTPMSLAGVVSMRKTFEACITLRRFKAATIDVKTLHFYKCGSFRVFILKTDCRDCVMSKRTHRSNTNYFMFRNIVGSPITVRCFSHSMCMSGKRCCDTRAIAGIVSEALYGLVSEVMSERSD
jgi:hypothetical protein